MRLFAVILALFSMHSSAQVLRDYSLMNHRIFIDSLRSGNHDESGENEYYFVLRLQSVRNTKEDLVKDIKDRPAVDQSRKEFGEVKIPVLAQWQPAGKKLDDELYIDITGDEIRTIVAASMTSFGVKESEIAMVGIIEMWERNKMFGYFGEDYKVGEVRYFPIPASEYHAAARTNLKLNLEDEKGTSVDVKIRYETPRTMPSANKSENTPPRDSLKDELESQATADK